MCLAIILAILSGAHPNQLEYMEWVQCEAMGVMRKELANSYRAYSLSGAVVQWSRFKASWRTAAPITSPSLGQQGPSTATAVGANGVAQPSATSSSLASSAVRRLALAQQAGAGVGVGQQQHRKPPRQQWNST